MVEELAIPISCLTALAATCSKASAANRRTTIDSARRESSLRALFEGSQVAVEGGERFAGEMQRAR